MKKNNLTAKEICNKLIESIYTIRNIQKETNWKQIRLYHLYYAKIAIQKIVIHQFINVIFVKKRIRKILL